MADTLVPADLDVDAFFGFAASSVSDSTFLAVFGGAFFDPGVSLAAFLGFLGSSSSSEAKGSSSTFFFSFGFCFLTPSGATLPPAAVPEVVPSITGAAAGLVEPEASSVK